MVLIILSFYPPLSLAANDDNPWIQDYWTEVMAVKCLVTVAAQYCIWTSDLADLIFRGNNPDEASGLRKASSRCVLLYDCGKDGHALLI